MTTFSTAPRTLFCVSVLTGNRGFFQIEFFGQQDYILSCGAGGSGPSRIKYYDTVYFDIFYNYTISGEVIKS